MLFLLEKCVSILHYGSGPAVPFTRVHGELGVEVKFKPNPL